MLWRILKLSKRILGIDWNRKASWKEVVVECVVIVGIMAIIAYLFSKAIPCMTCEVDKIKGLLNR